MGKGAETASRIAIPLAAAAIGVNLGGPKGALTGFQIGRQITGASGGSGGEGGLSSGGGFSQAQQPQAGIGLLEQLMSGKGRGTVQQNGRRGSMGLPPQQENPYMSEFELLARRLFSNR